MRLIILIVIAIVVLSYFNVNLRSLFESERFKENFAYFWNLIKTVWDRFLEAPVAKLWNLLLDWLKTKI